MPRLAIKIDVDTDRGTRDGVLPLAEICRRHKVPAVFLFSLGPDNMGKSIYRIFQPGFFRKITRTRVVSNYGLKTLLNGTLLPAPHLGRRYRDIMRAVRDQGFEAGVHCYDHYRWQNHVQRFSLAETRAEFGRAVAEFERIFGEAPRLAGAPGWQCTPHSLAVYDEARLVCASDTRGQGIFLPAMGGQTFRTPQIATTLPTLDELLGRPEFPEEKLVDHYLELIRAGGDHVLTIHAELEGLHYGRHFEELLRRAAAMGVTFYSWRQKAAETPQPPVCEIRLAELPGRAGLLAVQGEPAR